MAKKKDILSDEQKQFWTLAEISKIPLEMRQEIFDCMQATFPMSEEKKKNLKEIFGISDKKSASERDELLQNLEMIDNIVDDDLEDSSERLSEYDSYPHFLPRVEVYKYTLRVTLRGLRPAIYRKFSVPSNITLRHLSELIIDLMDWSGAHLNQFRKGNCYYSPAYQLKDRMLSDMGFAEDHKQECFTLSDILTEKGKTIEWEYDFGDSWIHEVKLSSIGFYEDNEPRVSFIKGERACPPEDCGGIWGYADMLEIIDKKKSRRRLTAEEKERLEWFDVDPKYFDSEEFDTEYAREVCGDYCR